MDDKRVRISDIAEELGLSTATVSNVLHGKTKKVSDQTVQRVQALLEERDYVPSMAGILLAQNSSRIIGVVVNDHEKYEGHTLEDVFIAASLNHLSEVIEEQGLFMMVKKTKNPEDIIKFASMWNMDGIVIIGFCNQDYMYLRNHMRIPFVVYDGYCEKIERIYNITIDNRRGGFLVGDYLRKQGHCKALCIMDNDICVDKDRYEGFVEGFGEGAKKMLIPMARDERRQFYLEKLSYIKEHTAIFAVSDYYAIDMMHFLQEHGMKIPNEIAVVGFDDTPMCTQVVPMLTSVKQDVAMRAKIAIEKLRELKEKADTETEVMLPVELIVRNSTSCVE